MLLASPFEDTKQSLLNVSGRVIDVVVNREITKFESVIALVERELQVSYDKVILALNFLHMIGALEYDLEKDILRFDNEIK